jgi:hypothetical protein
MRIESVSGSPMNAADRKGAVNRGNSGKVCGLQTDECAWPVCPGDVREEPRTPYGVLRVLRLYAGRVGRGPARASGGGWDRRITLTNRGSTRPIFCHRGFTIFRIFTGYYLKFSGQLLYLLSTFHRRLQNVFTYCSRATRRLARPSARRRRDHAPILYKIAQPPRSTKPRTARPAV